MDEFMNAAIEEARQGAAEGGIPIGAVLVKDGIIIGRGRNRRIQSNDPILHAEIDCLRNAGRIGSYNGTTLYSTLMPCHLCAGAIVQFGIERIVVGESRSFHGARAFLRDHWVSVDDRDLDECVEILGSFIQAHPAIWNEDIGKS
jgi:creatinine deaminase